MTALIDPSAPVATTLPATLRLGPVHLIVSRLDRSVAWYRQVLGLRVLDHQASRAELGDGATTVLVLVEDAQALPAGRHAGLYHYALLYPSRPELARAAVRLSLARTVIDGASDHGTHEAIYLSDPDANGIELAADRPRAAWPSPEEEYSRGPRPLDLASLLETVEGEPPSAQVAEGLRIGHVHLHVGDVDHGLAFYRDVLGFALMARLPSAAFVSAGGYHHHLGFNVWRGRGVGPAPAGTVGLRHWTIVLDDEAQVSEVGDRVTQAGFAVRRVEDGFTTEDPWGTALAIVTDKERST